MGGCPIWHGLLYHGSPANRSGMRRRALQFHYETAGVEEVTEEEKLAVFRHFRGKSECPLLGCAVQRRRFPQWVKVPPGNRSSRKQPEQLWEVTKWLKPLVKRVTNW